MTFAYQPLDRTRQEIRLLEVFGHDQDVRFTRLPACRIFHASLKQSIGYVALSYAWGSADERRIVLVDGSPVYVTVNLYEALMTVRRPKVNLIIWVDYLCINQGDDQEKSWQVGLMDNIYRQASRVLAWLGPASRDSDDVMAFLSTIGRKAEACGIEFAEGPHLMSGTACSRQRLSHLSKHEQATDPPATAAMGPRHDSGQCNAEGPRFARAVHR